MQKFIVTQGFVRKDKLKDRKTKLQFTSNYNIGNKNIIFSLVLMKRNAEIKTMWKSICLYFYILWTFQFNWKKSFSTITENAAVSQTCKDEISCLFIVTGIITADSCHIAVIIPKMLSSVILLHKSFLRIHND